MNTTPAFIAERKLLHAAAAAGRALRFAATAFCTAQRRGLVSDGYIRADECANAARDVEVALAELRDVWQGEALAANRQTSAISSARGIALANARAAAIAEASEPYAPCPKCGVLIVDMDGIGVLAHAECGYCSHPSRDGDRCTICGHEQTTCPVCKTKHRKNTGQCWRCGAHFGPHKIPPVGPPEPARKTN